MRCREFARETKIFWFRHSSSVRSLRGRRPCSRRRSSIRERLEAIAHKGIRVEVPSLRQLQTWIAQWKATRRSLVAYVTAPDKWRGGYVRRRDFSGLSGR
ncbi:hypothetical protein [uncultured Desulfovibrio sp.]|uniref:hypothetical protein n=1 Tax=uncultured Desulfovibrio sp. TaxID=167968 RepID=UPI002624B1B2|nr:hypothetical protein [uncultured Desulfovibrio sp.]